MTIDAPPLAATDRLAAIGRALDGAGLRDMLAWPAYSGVGRDDVEAVLDEVERFADEVWAPTDRIGDTHPPRLDEHGAVVTPGAIRDAWRRFVEAGWPALALPAEHGGGGLPMLVGTAAEEVFDDANLALSLCPMLTRSSVHLLERWGTPDQQQRFMPQLVSGEWTGTMCLTEPQAGSDVGAVRTRAVPRDDGSWEVTGSKIYITWGDHDLSEGIVHLVLARTPGAPEGTRGLSLFLVPREQPGAPLRSNGVRVVGLEHKVGIHASPTCVLEFDGAVGELVGEVGDGMRGMFTMMNAARLSVGVEGLAVSTAAQRKARAFAAERVQGGVVIAEHPDVQRMLLTIDAGVAAMRALLYATAAAGDAAHHHPDSDQRAAAQARADLLTPLAKSWPTDEGVRLTSLALQVHGGMGYVEETGIAQHWRDSRIASIYEGTNGIQAIDLVERKVRRDGGAAMAALLADADDVIARLRDEHGENRLDVLDTDDLDAVVTELTEAVAAVRAATDCIVAFGDADDRRAVATPYLELVAMTAAAVLLARQVLVTSDEAGGADEVELRAFVLERLPAARSHLATIRRGAALLRARNRSAVDA